MIFYVIGNGFDIHYKLNTKYDNFKEYLLNKGYKDLIEKIDKLFHKHGSFSLKEIDTWSRFEDMLIVFNDLDAEELYDEAISNAETNDDRAGYWDSPSWNVSYYNRYIQILKQEFVCWIKTFDTKIIRDHYFNPQKGDYVLTFNYTTTIENNFPLNSCNILHIHGTAGQDLVLGHNKYQPPDLLLEKENSDYRDITTKKAVNKVLELASIQYYKNSKNIITAHKAVFSSIPTYDKTVIMGLSCGEQDSIYIKKIIKYSRNIDFYYHDDSAILNFKKYISNCNICVTYIYW